MNISDDSSTTRIIDATIEQIRAIVVGDITNDSGEMLYFSSNAISHICNLWKAAEAQKDFYSCWMILREIEYSYRHVSANPYVSKIYAEAADIALARAGLEALEADEKDSA